VIMKTNAHTIYIVPKSTMILGSIIAFGPGTRAGQRLDTNAVNVDDNLLWTGRWWWT